MPPTTQEKPYVVITEQPQSKALRFRYECEGRSAGSIPGVRTTPEQKTFPSIEVRGYKGRALAVVSCVTKDPPYRPHPHNLVGKEGCKQGVCTVQLDSSTMSYIFSNLGIQCVKKKGIEEALRLRENIRVDPFRTGYGHAKQPATIDLNAVRLCFQVFVEGQQPGRFTEALQPVVSDIIFDKKAMSDLVICKLSDVTAPVTGGKEIILLCEKVAKEDISVRFYEEQHGKILWMDTGEFQHNNVHKQVAICFRTPRYRTLEVDQSVMVNIQLRRPSDGATSEPLPFELIPVDTLSQKRKRQKISSCEISEHVPEGAHGGFIGHMVNIPEETVKTDRRESPPQFHGFQGTYRCPNDVSMMQRSPIAPLESTSTFMGENNMAMPPRGYQPGPGNDFYMGGQPTQNQYNYPQQQQQILRAQQHPQNQFQLPSTSSNVHYNMNNLMNGGLPIGSSQGTNQQMGNAAEYNLSNLLDMELGKEFTMNSSEIKSIVGHLTITDIKQENYQQRMQDEEENLSNSFTRLTTNPMNDLGK
ncbi:embryonic polarity protein dorsal-like [Malaya genurostris]|uniref:embryonic polarity protein dorsal-like n=1 Tax=Malaya genurostris TaxID=325434 RepID=UPI0026F38C3D|nr:embryonic polarity protein dorsal-like [Malaya genurostris]